MILGLVNQLKQLYYILQNINKTVIIMLSKKNVKHMGAL